MRRTVYIPDELDVQLEKYLEENKDETFSKIVQKAVERVVAKNRIQALLDLAGTVDAPDANPHDGRPEDAIFDAKYIP